MSDEPFYEAIVVRYGELALKGKNRPFFEEHLARNLRERWSRDGIRASIVKSRGRFVVWPDDKGDVPRAIEALRQVFGVESLSPALRCEPSIERIGELASRVLESALRAAPADGAIAFKVDTRRADKQFPMTSPEISAEVAGSLLERFPRLKVDLEEPRITVGLEVRVGEAFLFAERVGGPGGLPVGSSGRVVALLSAGIDSPVAAYLAMKRGCRVILCHFHSYPFL